MALRARPLNWANGATDMSSRFPNVKNSYARERDAIIQHGAYESTRLLINEPGRLAQTRNYCLARDGIELSLFRYVVGDDMSDVRAPLLMALSAYTRVFDLYGTEKRMFPAIDLTK